MKKIIGYTLLSAFFIWIGVFVSLIMGEWWAGLLLYASTFLILGLLYLAIWLIND